VSVVIKGVGRLALQSPSQSKVTQLEVTWRSFHWEAQAK
jgi:hypothetical protein